MPALVPRTLSDPVYQFDIFELDCGRFSLTRNGHLLRMERKPMELLILLAERRGGLLSRAEIVEQLWGREVFVDTEHGINTAIRKIRQALRDDAEEPRFVETVMGKGYRFVAPVVVRSADDRAGGDRVGEYGAGEQGEPVLSSVETEVPASQIELAKPEPILVPETAPETALPEKSVSWSRRRRMGWGIAALLLVAVAVGVATRSWMQRRAAQASVGSIAVLQLDNLSGDPGQDYLAEGMTDELTTMLVKSSTLQVTSRTSVKQFKGAHRSLREIAQELGVNGILEGSMSRSGDKVHMTIQLIQEPSDIHLWAESYDRDASDLVSLPRETAQAIAKLLKSPVPPPPPERYVSPEAHDAYVHGHYLWITGDLEEAHPYFKKATELQPDYALGWSGLADYYSAGIAFGQLDPRQAGPQAEAAAKKALQLDDSLAQAHLSMAAVYFICRWDWVQADREILRAIELDPKLADAYFFRAMLLSTLNRHQEAIESEKKSLEIDPFGRPYALADFYNMARQYDAALKDSFQRFESAPNNIGVHFEVADAYRHKGMYKESVEFEEKADILSADKESASGIRRAFQRGGYKGVILWRIDSFQKQSATHYVSPESLAALYAQLGDRDKTLSLLEGAYQQHSPGLFDLQTDPAFDFLHADPRYRSLIQRIGLPPAY